MDSSDSTQRSGRSQAADAARVVLALGHISDDPATWTQPVVRVDGSVHPDVVETINTPRLIGAIDQLLGRGQWLPRTEGFGTFPIRCPSESDPGDTGWHIDGSFGEPPFYKVNLGSRGRALLLLMLFTDVSVADAPTRVRVGSHLDVARALEALGGDQFFDPPTHAPLTMERPVEYAVGPAGTVYLCHPFLVHAASWPHTGTSPRVISQPCIHHPEGEWLGGFDYTAAPDSPVKQAVRHALESFAPVSFRDATPDDVPAVESYHHRCFEKTYATRISAGEFGPPDRTGTREQLRSWFQPGSELVTRVAVVDDSPIGHFTVFGHQLVHLFVAPDHQGTGLGRHLLAEAETMIAAAGHTEFELHTRVENSQAIAFYEAAGWTMTDRLVHTVEHGITYDEHVLVKRRP